MNLSLQSRRLEKQVIAHFNQSLPQETTATSKEKEITWEHDSTCWLSDFWYESIAHNNILLCADGQTEMLPSDGSKSMSSGGGGSHWMS